MLGGELAKQRKSKVKVLINIPSESARSSNTSNLGLSQRSHQALTVGDINIRGDEDDNVKADSDQERVKPLGRVTEAHTNNKSTVRQVINTTDPSVLIGSVRKHEDESEAYDSMAAIKEKVAFVEDRLNKAQAGTLFKNELPLRESELLSSNRHARVTSTVQPPQQPNYGKMNTVDMRDDEVTVQEKFASEVLTKLSGLFTRLDQMESRQSQVNQDQTQKTLQLEKMLQSRIKEERDDKSYHSQTHQTDHNQLLSEDKD